MDPVQLCLDLQPPAPPAPPPPPPRPYAAVLREGAGMTHRQRDAAQMRFEAALEDRLGSPEEVAALVRQLMQAEIGGDPPAPELVRRWERANAAARYTGLQSLADQTDAWFEVSLTS
ncbi:hypothetical protein GCM10007320_40940 [Pseudorhodoferax aquiterrae]|uniref:Uncharacterized protein n=2 Tax=Pseudorhodoferax aquiterrae TaxID=747304 RepID=A0ABQ3G6U9_9BURK|nr:hypothetical protein GCM10007320_40940 [Pseudorhodoferax aquiterrae]